MRVSKIAILAFISANLIFGSQIVCSQEATDDLQEIVGDMVDIAGPFVSVKTKGPLAIEADEPANYHVVVENTSDKKMASVKLVFKHKSSGLLDAQPGPSDIRKNELEFDIPELEPKSKHRFMISLLAPKDGDISVKANCIARSTTDLGTVVKRPSMFLDVKGPHEIKMGEEAPFTISIQNIGDGIIKKGSLMLDLGPSVALAKSDEKMFETFQIAGNETKHFNFKLTPVEAGTFKLKFHVNTVNAENRTIQSTLIARSLKPTVHLVGPGFHEVGSKARYSLIIENRTNENLENALVDVRIPSFLRLKTVSQEGSYIRDKDQQMHMTWYFDRLDQNSRKIIHMESDAMTVSNGDYQIAIESNGRLLQKESFAAQTTKKSVATKKSDAVAEDKRPDDQENRTAAKEDEPSTAKAETRVRSS